MVPELACPERSDGTQHLQTGHPASEATRRADFERVWSWEMLPTRTRWLARASDPGLNEARRVYAERRATSLARPYHARQDACELTGSPVKCGCRVPGDPAGTTPAAFKGRRRDGVRWHACRRHLTCDRCRLGRSCREGARIRTSLENHLDRELGARGRTKHVVMMTISLRHSGDVRADRVALAESWRRFRDAYAHRWGRFSYVGVYEVTPGRDGLGHVHAHVLCLWPLGQAGDGTAADWRIVRRMWLDAARGDSEVPLFSVVRRSEDAAGYVAKYIAKGIASAEFSPQLAAKVASATYNSRWVFASRFFWLKWENVCGSCGQKVTRVTFRFSSVENPPHPPPSDWSRGPPDGRYQQASFTLSGPHECGRSSGVGRRDAMGDVRGGATRGRAVGRC